VIEDQANEKTSKFWGSDDANPWRSSKLIHWLEHPRVQARNNFLVCGDPARHRWEFFINRYFGQKKVQRVLTFAGPLQGLTKRVAQYYGLGPRN
jgi:hypothetical protein